MVEDAPTEADLKLPRRLALVLVVVTARFTITSFRIAERDLIDLDKSVFIFLPPLLFVIGLSTVALFRGIVLPEMARNSQISQPLRLSNPRNESALLPCRGRKRPGLSRNSQS